MKVFARRCEKKNATHSGKLLKYSNAVIKDKGISTLPHENSLRIKKMRNNFLTRSDRIWD